MPAQRAARGVHFYHLNGLVESHGRYEQARKLGVWQRFD